MERRHTPIDLAGPQWLADVSGRVSPLLDIEYRCFKPFNNKNVKKTKTSKFNCNYRTNEKITFKFSVSLDGIVPDTVESGDRDCDTCFMH